MNLGEERQMVMILLHEDSDLSVEQVVEHTGKIPSATVHSSGPRIVCATLEKKDLSAIAALDSVHSIEPRYPIEPDTVVAREILGYTSPLTDPVGDRYKGEGEVVGVADTGFDMGSVTDTHPAFRDRVKTLTAVGRSVLTNDPDGHGTHVAGCVLGNSSGKSGWLCKGTAPSAFLVFQSLLDDNGKLVPTLFSQVFDATLKEGGYINNCSYGTSDPSAGFYGMDALTIDIYCNKNPEFIPVVSAGNRGEKPVGEQEIGWAATAKNAVTVGATQTTRPCNGVKYLARGGQVGGVDIVGAFSSPGQPPQADPSKPAALIKPDVVAPGVAILSAASRDPAVQLKKGPLGLQIRNGDVLDKFGETGDNNYMFQSGTSQAAPLVAGHIAVLRSAFIKERGYHPNSAMIRALLVHGTVDLSLAGGTCRGTAIAAAPNNIQGHGRVNIEASLNPLLKGTIFQGYFDPDEVLDPKAVPPIVGILPPMPIVKIITPNNPATSTFRATFAQIDLAAAKLQNRLFLRAEVGCTFTGGVNTPRVKQPGVMHDTAGEQVIERISVPSVPANTNISLEIHAVADNGVPSAIVAKTYFAVVWSVDYRGMV